MFSSWTSILLIIVMVLLVMLVIRLSEVSTRMKTLENATARVVDDNAKMVAMCADFITNTELTAILRHRVPPYFSVGKQS